MVSNYYIIEVVDYSSEHILSKIKDNRIKVELFQKIDDYIFHLTIDVKQYSRLVKVFPNCKIVYTRGLFFIIKNRLVQKVTVFSMAVGILFFVFLSTLIFRVEVKGNNQRITDNIYQKLDDYDIVSYKKIPNDDVLYEVKESILNENSEIESVDYSVQGTIIVFTYFLKEKENVHFAEYGKYYAKKDGIICYVDIECGNFLYSTNDYVKHGSLLIDDYVHINDKSLYVGGYGKVYAYTWSIVELSVETNGLERAEVYSLMVSNARYGVSKDFSSSERIEKENVLLFSYNESVSIIKIHYSLIENIAFLQKK